jgi:hypothetical protein
MNDKWKCGLCCEVNNSSTTLKRKHDDINDKLSSTEKQIAEKLILQMYTHPSSVPFHHPVPADVRHLKKNCFVNFPFFFKCIGYHKVIGRPMDLRTIKEKINSYSTMSEFLTDIRLMFQNCSTFNRVCIFIRIDFFSLILFFI